MSDNTSNDDVLVPASAVKWIALAGGILFPLFLAVVGAHVYYAGSGSQHAQVFPLPEE
ncbi:hypothetical protein JMM63_13535 [Rhodovulum sulfidophilum]|uniref:Uncharacterized protein n=1 Tax=Rhodovulum sulfidophilum TaxID=35806 RepID=A0A0D6B2F5_RHOSU|nr:hypothetical protein [Rhodovulum sulfidophilum]MBL3550845.1 hypothetical protein [Rhodovulum sulfidophilum]MBL3561343.1 hypothetical protein [Rhodovulum sulfidophilum]MBL3564640.1 hypothetical protein [Rhodovulum sulfidophilum]MBL3574939.1 hypothetical protein [Rhodovulum sulfidophilum]MBL3584493.1 hypothetical protein [Rhodovulum sulfidophilum]